MRARGGEDYNLWQIQGVVANGVEDEILELVDGAEQILAESCHCDGVESWKTTGVAKERARGCRAEQESGKARAGCRCGFWDFRRGRWPVDLRCASLESKAGRTGNAGLGQFWVVWGASSRVCRRVHGTCKVLGHGGETGGSGCSQGSPAAACATPSNHNASTTGVVQGGHRMFAPPLQREVYNGP